MEKPLEILQLEKDYNLNFIEVFDVEDLFDYVYDEKISKYLIRDHKVVGLSIYYYYYSTKFFDFGMLKSLTSLEYLDLAFNKIEKIENVDCLINLIRLELNDNNIAKIENLDALKNLKSLKLDSNKISKIENLTELSSLEKLDLGDNQIIEIENLQDLKNLKELDLSSNKIVEIKNLNQLTNLKTVYLNYTDIVKIDNLEDLKTLKELNLESNKIIKIENLEDLINLEKLNLAYNQIVEIENLDNLENLKILNLEDNKIIKIENLENLVKLEKLELGENAIENISKIENLKSLHELILYGNQISKIENLENLKQLDSLDLSGNQISKIENLENLKHLDSLDLSRNQISKIENLGENLNLNELVLSNNKISVIENLDSLKNLQSLSLSRNNISILENLEELEKLEELYIDNNNISYLNEFNVSNNINTISLTGNHISDIRILIEKYINRLNFAYENKRHRKLENVVSLDNNPLGDDLEARLKIKDLINRKNSLIDYYENIKLGAEPFREAKLMLLGEGGAGKTNFSNYIMGIPFVKGKSATTGIKIDHWSPIINQNDYRINIWDFGGQWIQQQIHQFFLTSECVYVIILNARNTEQPFKWLDWIKNYGSNSKTIIVLNQMEENANRYLEENNLKVEYPFIHSFHYVSLLRASEGDDLENMYLSRLIQNIIDQLILLKNIHALYPINYHELKTDLEDNFLNDNHSLAFDTFEEKFIQKYGIKGNSEILLKVLQTMGTLRYFENHGRLILSPEWLSDGVYKIMMSKIANEKFGFLKEKDIVTIMKEECDSQYSYKTPDIYFIRQLMQDFELAYIDENKNYFIPTQFKTDIPDDFDISKYKENAILEFTFDFDTYFPEILISKLIVHFFNRVNKNIYWKTGIFLRDFDSDLNKLTFALVQSIEKERRIKIFMLGEDVRNFFKEIRARILSYLKVTNYKYKEYVLYKKLDTLIDYKELITLYKNGIKEKQIVYRDNVTSINVIEALGIINNEKELEALRKEIEELKKEKTLKNQTTNISIHGNVENVQTGNESIQIINKNSINYNLKELETTKEEIKAFIDEVEKLKVQGEGQENINEIFIELLHELSTVDLKYIEENPKEAKTFIQKIYDNGKWMNDWKNITILPYEIWDKGGKIIEAIKPALKPLLTSLQ